jgi:major membrane immunogen (membrane-anchored lipoprotein)
MRTITVALASALLAGCGKSDPPQPQLTDAQVKEAMNQGKDQHSRESGGRGGPGR